MLSILVQSFHSLFINVRQHVFREAGKDVAGLKSCVGQPTCKTPHMDFACSKDRAAGKWTVARF